MSSSAFFPSGLNNWAASDKPQRADFVNDNRVVDAALSALSTTKTGLNLYISPSGNDSTGNGSAEKPYASFARTWADVPRIVCHAVTINVGAGSYGEVFTARDRLLLVGSIAVRGASNLAAAPSYKIPQLVIGNIIGGIVQVEGLECTYNAADWAGAFIVGHNANVAASYISMPSVTYSGFVCTAQSFLNIQNSSVSNKRRAFYAIGNGVMRVYLSIGSNNEVAFYGQQSGIVADLGNPVGYTYARYGTDSGIVLGAGVIS